MNTQFDCKSTTHPDTPVTNIPSLKVCMPHPNLLADSTATDSFKHGTLVSYTPYCLVIPVCLCNLLDWSFLHRRPFFKLMSHMFVLV